MVRILLKRKFLLAAGAFTIFILIRYIVRLEYEVDTDVDNHQRAQARASKTLRLLENMTAENYVQYVRKVQGRIHHSAGIMTTDTIFPSIFTYLPHLISNPEGVWPKIHISKGRTNVSFVIGLPSIKRPKGVYVYDTVQSLLTGMNDIEKDDVVIVVCLTEPWDEVYEMQVIDVLMARYHSEISQGLLEIITPYPGLYPDLDSLKLTLGDNSERVKWRSKQNIDYAFLMLHSWRKGKYYIQLEDDVRAAPGYVTSMKEAIKKNQRIDWFTLEFSVLGFIGRLFKSEDVPKMLEFLLMFYSQKPCDWLYGDYMQVKVCRNGEKWAECINKIRNVALPMRPSLFQHEGLHSSLGGTRNELKDKEFEANQSDTLQNPPVESIITTLEEYSNYNIYSAYSGSTVFWALSPKEGDLIDFLFQEPVKLASVHIVTGNTEHAEDIFRNTTVEILPIKLPESSSPYYQNKVNNNGGRSSTKQQKFAYEQRINKISDLKKLPENDTFYTVGEFSKDGISSFEIPEEFGKIWVLRIRVLSTSHTWVLIKKIAFQVR